MDAMLFSVTSCRFMADWWGGSSWRFWSNLFLIIPNAAVIIGTTFVLNFHILPISFSRSCYLLSFSVSFVFMFKSLVWLYWSVGKSSLFYHAVLYQDGAHGGGFQRKEEVSWRKTVFIKLSQMSIAFPCFVLLVDKSSYSYLQYKRKWF